MQNNHALDVVCNGEFQRIPIPNIYITIGTLRNIISKRFHIDFPFILTYNGAFLDEGDTLHDLALNSSRPIIVRRKSHDETYANNLGTDIYLSYEQTHRFYVENFRQELQLRNYTCCIDMEKIEQGIQQSTVFVCFITGQYVMSNKCQREFNYARQQGKKIIFLLLESMDWPPPQIAGLVSGIPFIRFYHVTSTVSGTPWPADKFNEFLDCLANFAPQL